jgi:hypothetical protein
VRVRERLDLRDVGRSGTVQRTEFVVVKGAELTPVPGETSGVLRRNRSVTVISSRLRAGPTRLPAVNGAFLLSSSDAARLA